MTAAVNATRVWADKNGWEWAPVGSGRWFKGKHKKIYPLPGGRYAAADGAGWQDGDFATFDEAAAALGEKPKRGTDR